ncbi:MAG TPA: FAD-dependent monooxygenase, partial [Xanthobacteraceae bacterium]|nr:FAD-dependent monooxygenase [Xanthobacteraceae bacterium]
MSDSDVLIVGAGPTGLTLAIDLGRRGVHCTLIEQKERPAFLPKMERINARTMEIYRRMGLAEKIRAAGLRPDCPMDVYIMLALNEPPLLRLHYPSVAQAQAETRATNDGTLPLEPYQLISQYTLEPLLKAVAETMPAVSVRFGCEFLSLRQDESGVTARVRSGAGEEELRAAYLVGCDGGASPVRKELGIRLAGEGNMMSLRQALYRCDELFERLPIGNGPSKGRHYHVADDKATQLIMQDSTKHWTLHSIVDSNEEMNATFERTVGVPVKYE